MEIDKTPEEHYIAHLEAENQRLRALVARAVGILEAWPVYDDWEDAIDEAVAILRQPLPPAPSQAQEGRG